jgi:hypothetical protein
MEDRFFRRVIFRQEIEAIAKDGLFPAAVENISLGGVFLRTNKDIPAGEQIEINIPLRNEFTTSKFSAKLTAIRAEQKGIAFKFTDLDPKNFWTLQSFIKATS